MQSTKGKTKPTSASAELREAEAAKTSRLRALRLAKEAEDRESAARAAAFDPRKPARRRVAQRPAAAEKPESS